MRILVTGAFGFVGSNLSAYLAQRGHVLIALDVTQRENPAYGDFYTWEELERIPWGEVDAVVHLAGKAHDTRNTSDPKRYFDVNVGLTKKVMEAMGKKEDGTTKNTKGTEVGGQCGLVVSRQDAKAQRKENSSIPSKKFIFFSSVKAVADRVEGVLTEEVVPDPKTPYGQSKLEAEKAVQSAIGNRQSAIKSYILRPCMIHGPGNKGNLNLLYGLVKKGLPWPLGTFENKRSFASIGNVCAVVEGVLKGDVESGVYQVADDEALSTNELVGLMAESLGRKAKVWKISVACVRALARIGDMLRLPLNSERLTKLTESYVASNAKIKAALGWEHMPVDARDGMRRTLMSFETTKHKKHRGDRRAP